MTDPRPPKLWVLSELYYPEETSTGHVMTAIAEHMARLQPVGVITAEPSYSAKGRPAPAFERRLEVDITRVRSGRWNRHRIFGRLLNALTFSAATASAGFKKVKTGDVVFVVTNPPTLPFVAWLVARMRGSKCVLLVHDVHPEQMVAAGIVQSGGALTRMLAAANRFILRRMDLVIAIGRDMADLCRAKIGGDRPPVVVVPNWSDVDQVLPADKKNSEILAELGWENRFVVQYAGNMGRPNALEAIIETATRLRADHSIGFLFVGAGAKHEWLLREVAARALSNVVVRSSLPRSAQTELLNSCDVGIVPLVPGMLGLGVPSRTYNLLAAGKPIVALVHPDSEVARLVQEESIGWVVPDTQPELLDGVILAAKTDVAGREAMARRARDAAEERFARPVVLRLFEPLLRVGSSEA